MSEYPKINTLYKRDSNGKIIRGEWVDSNVKYLRNNLWECTEKIDGTNIRIEVNFTPVCEPEGAEDAVTFSVKGRTDNANIPSALVQRMYEICNKINWKELFPTCKAPTSITIYGEGYGKKIQKVGAQYLKDDVDFILFDVRVGRWWLGRSSCEDIASKLGVKIVPFKGLMTIDDAVATVAKGFTSEISEDKNLLAEGLVLRAPCGLSDNAGNRLIYKIKYKDFK